MGLLDDAIREHLELKRRRGADPSEIARDEHEALEPVFPDEPAPEAVADEPVGEGETHETPDEDTAPAAGDVPLVQETAELDMQTVLDAGPEDANGGPSVDPVSAHPADVGHDEEALEWEMPGDSDSAVAPEQVPGQERLTFE